MYYFGQLYTSVRTRFLFFMCNLFLQGSSPNHLHYFFSGVPGTIAAAVLFSYKEKDGAKTLKKIEKEIRLNLHDHIKRFSTSPLSIISPLVIEAGMVKNSVLKKCSAEAQDRIRSCLNLEEDGIGFLVAGPQDFVLPILGKQR